MLKCNYPSEDQEQMALMEWVRLHERMYPELKLIYHIPNGGSRNKAEAAKFKKMGVKRGVPDLALPCPKGKYHGLYIELKSRNGVESNEQKEWIANLNRQGFYAVFSYGWEEARDIILKYLRG